MDFKPFSSFDLVQYLDCMLGCVVYTGLYMMPSKKFCLYCLVYEAVYTVQYSWPYGLCLTGINLLFGLNLESLSDIRMGGWGGGGGPVSWACSPRNNMPHRYVNLLCFIQPKVEQR